MTTTRDRHLADYLDRAEYWYAGQSTAHELEANRAFAANWDNLRAAFDWALANHRHRDVADLLHTTYWYAVHTGQWEHHQWALAARCPRERHRVGGERRGGAVGRSGGRIGHGGRRAGDARTIGAGRPARATPR